MTDPQADASAHVEALVAEIRAEMGRRGVTSVRALAEMIGVNHVTLNDRLGPKRKPLTVRQLFDIGNALGVEPRELIRRAEAGSSDSQATHDADTA